MPLASAFLTIRPKADSLKSTLRGRSWQIPSLRLLSLASARYRLRLRGDELVARHDAEALERATARQIAAAFEGTAEELCRAVRHRVPSAKPCRMKGMNSQKIRTQLRAGDIAGWGIDRLLAVAATLGLRAEIRLVAIGTPTEAA